MSGPVDLQKKGVGLAGPGPMDVRTAKWRDYPRGGTISGGANGQHFKTGDWRSFRPIHIKENCIHCLLCWIYCPDMAVVAEDGKMVGFDYEHCKGCGICAEECPTKDKAIEMVSEEGHKSERESRLGRVEE